MKVWILTHTKDYSETLLGVFSSKEKAVEQVTAFCKQEPDFENETCWSPEFDENDEYDNPGFYMLFAVNVDTPTGVRLYVE